MTRPRVALVIPTLDEEAAITDVIAAVPPDVVDRIIVVDSSAAITPSSARRRRARRSSAWPSAAMAGRAAPARRLRPIATSSCFWMATAAIVPD